jgi:hypothetical protein
LDKEHHAQKEKIVFKSIKILKAAVNTAMNMAVGKYKVRHTYIQIMNLFDHRLNQLLIRILD